MPREKKPKKPRGYVPCARCGRKVGKGGTSPHPWWTCMKRRGYLAVKGQNYVRCGRYSYLLKRLGIVRPFPTRGSYEMVWWNPDTGEVVPRHVRPDYRVHKVFERIDEVWFENYAPRGVIELLRAVHSHLVISRVGDARRRTVKRQTSVLENGKWNVVEKMITEVDYRYPKELLEYLVLAEVETGLLSVLADDDPVTLIISARAKLGLPLPELQSMAEVA